MLPRLLINTFNKCTTFINSVLIVLLYKIRIDYIETIIWFYKTVYSKYFSGLEIENGEKLLIKLINRINCPLLPLFYLNKMNQNV